MLAVFWSPGLSDIYPAEDLQLANNIMGVHWRDTILFFTNKVMAQRRKYLSLIGQFDEDEALDDFTRIREMIGIAPGKDNGWSHLRVGELKSMLALAGGDLRTKTH